jgi:hypothetical protein
MNITHYPFNNKYNLVVCILQKKSLFPRRKKESDKDYTQLKRNTFGGTRLVHAHEYFRMLTRIRRYCAIMFIAFKNYMT